VVLVKPISLVALSFSALDTFTDITSFSGYDGDKTTPLFSLKSYEVADAKIRLRTVRDLYNRGLIGIDGIIDYYHRWVIYDEYMLLQFDSVEPSLKKTGNRDVKYVAVKCAKRGNDIYSYRVKKSLFDIVNSLDNTVFFNSKERNFKTANTSALSFVLTYDPGLCSLSDAWLNVGKDFDAWLNNLRKKYGKISIFRTWEVCNNGYPHINAILLFHDVSFSVFKYKEKFRIKEKSEFSKYWHSFIDVQAVSDMKKSFFYITKYVTKYITKTMQTFDKKALLTLSMLWFFGKRSFSVSKGFVSQLECVKDLNKERLDRNMHNSSQLSLIGEKLTKNTYVFLGIYSKATLEILNNPWTVEIPRLLVQKLLNF